MIINKQGLKTHNGFTLIELMVVVAIIGLLASIAYPNYQDSVIRSRRADAKGALLGFANAMERYFTENNTYLGAGGTAGTPANTGSPRVFSTQSPIDGTTAYYALIIQAATQTTYNLRATPVVGTSQASDGILEINNTEAKGRWDSDNSGTIGVGEETWD